MADSRFWRSKESALTFIEGVVDCPYFPLGVGEWPFVVFLYEDVVGLFYFSFEDEVETARMRTCRLDPLLR